MTSDIMQNEHKSYALVYKEWEHRYKINKTILF